MRKVLSFAVVVTFAVTILLSLSVSLLAPQSERVLAQWQFERNGDLQGWQPNSQVKDVKVANGILSFRTEGDDPILELRAPFEIPTSPWQVIEIRLKADRDGVAEFFWSNTTEPPYGGFRPHKRTPFSVIGDGKWRTYRILPFWHLEGKIIRLRFDPFGGANFEVEFIRIVELETGRGTRDAGRITEWLVIGDTSVKREKEGWTVTMNEPNALLLAPISADAEANSFISFHMAVSKGNYATVYFANEKEHGLKQVTVYPIVADGKEYTYNLDMIVHQNWHGRIIALGLRPSDEAGAIVRLNWFNVESKPSGSPSLRVINFALDDASPRVGVPTSLVATITNSGGETARNVKVRLVLPKGIDLKVEPSSRIESLEFEDEVTLQWQVVAQRPTKGEAILDVVADNAPKTTAKVPLNFLPRPFIPKSDYVPKPNPVRGKYEVGVYYFPGWHSFSSWFYIFRFPERKPFLGWYREGDPEVADWHIKWAVEHGITFFAYDWYWERGARKLEHALHNGYMKARYRNLLKFCLLWANHNQPKTSSLEDCITVTRFWIEHYFRQPEYLTIDGKPVVFIFQPSRLTEDLGGEGVRKAFDVMRQECLNHGLKGLYLVACLRYPDEAKLRAQEGYDAVSAYTWTNLGRRALDLWAPYDSLLEGYRNYWQQIVKVSQIPLILPINGGWDPRPWYGDVHSVRFGRTPQKFRQHLQDAKAFLDKFVPKGEALPIAIIEAWNEWGEGSYIEPHAEFGFGYLDAVREVFTDASKEHIDLTPVDVGLALKEVERLPIHKNSWEFEEGDEGWRGWVHLRDVRVENGRLIGETTGYDPIFFGPPVRIRASQFRFVIVKMRLQSKDGKVFPDKGQLFWKTLATSLQLPANIYAFSPRAAFTFTVQVDGQWHEYRLPVHESKSWRGIINSLRIDPCTNANVLVEVDYIKVAP